MKKMYLLPALMLTAVILTAQPASAIDLGMPFGFGSNTTFGAHGGGYWGSDIGLRMHFTDVVAVQPSISLGMGSRGDDNVTNLGINVDALFYLFESNGIKQYLGANVGIDVGTDAPDNGNFRLGAIFGLQHPIADAIYVFGQVGLGMRFEPTRLYTVNTQVGVIFYISR
jgi:hypothetical protein